MYVQKEMEQYVKNMKKFVDKFNRGEEIDPVIHYKIITEGWNIRENQIIVWEYVMNRLSLEKLEKIVPRGHRKIKEILQQMKIPIRTYHESHRQPKLEKESIEKSRNLILGTLLGDAHLRKPEGKVKTSLYTHINTKKEYSLWIQKQLDKLKIQTNFYAKENKDVKNTKPSYRVRTKKYSYFYQLRQEWYPEGIKIVPKSLELNPEILLYWYLDDGCGEEQKDYLRLKLYTDSFDEKSDDYLIKKLFDTFGILAKRQYKKSSNSYYLRLNKEGSIKYLSLIFSKYENMNISCFDYKFEGLI